MLYFNYKNKTKKKKGGGGKMMLKKYKIYKIYKLLKKARIEPDITSPNFIADFSYNREIYLSSDEVVYISNNYK